MDDPVVKQYLKDIADKLSSGEFPSGTHTTTFLEFEVQLGRTAMRIKTMDYPGEDFRDGITKDTPQKKIKEFAEHLLKSDIIILLADPNDIPAQAANIEKHKKIIDSINTNLQAARSVLKEQKAKDKELKYADVCIAVGKFDKLPEFEAVKKAKDGGKQIAEQFFQKHWANFAETLANNKDKKLKKITYFPISAVGNTIPSERSTSRDKDGLAPDQEHLVPFGYEGLFRWIADRKNRLARIKRWAKISFAATVLVVLVVGVLFAFGSKTVIDYEAEKQQLAALERQDISIAQKLERTTTPASDKVVIQRNKVLDAEIERWETEVNKAHDSQTLIFF
jgi:hypothetical protein